MLTKSNNEACSNMDKGTLDVSVPTVQAVTAPPFSQEKNNSPHNRIMELHENINWDL